MNDNKLFLSYPSLSNYDKSWPASFVHKIIDSTFSYSYGTSFKYIKNGFFLDIPYDDLLMDNVYKENYRINNIHKIKFYSDIKVGIDAFNNMILLDNNGFKKSKLYS